jgi:hypothetical protein
MAWKVLLAGAHGASSNDDDDVALVTWGAAKGIWHVVRVCEVLASGRY